MRFVKPSGQVVEVSENSESHARSIGWIPADEKPAKAEEVKQEEPKAKRGRPKKGFF